MLHCNQIKYHVYVMFEEVPIDILAWLFPIVETILQALQNTLPYVCCMQDHKTWEDTGKLK